MPQRSRRIAVRVDGSCTLGMGHVMRCLALGEALRLMNAELVFVMRDHREAVETVRGLGWRVQTIAVTAASGDAANEIQRWRPDMIVTDLYPTEAADVERLGATGTPVVCLTSLGCVDLPAAVVVNGDLRFRDQARRVNRHSAECYLGPEYFVLRGGLRQPPMRRDTSTRVSRLLVTLGGADPQGLTLHVLRALDRAPGDMEVTVALGQGFGKQVGDIERVGKISRHVRVLRDVEQMSELMRRSDLAIVAGGFTVYELAATGTPGVILCQHRHQEETAQAFEDAGTCLNLGLGTLVNEARLIQVLVELIASPSRRQAMSAAGPNLVDGQGAQRVAKVIDGVLHRVTRSAVVMGHQG